jgi:hypothetical protein
MPRASFALVSFFCLTVASVAGAQVPPGCGPIFAANDKLAETPYHAVTTTSLAGRPQTSETVSVGEATYVLTQGQWTRSPTTPKARLAAEREELRKAKSYTCTLVGDETVDGVSATHYRTHLQSATSVSDTDVWIVKATGLPVKRETDLTRGGGTGLALHNAQRFDYASIHVPPGVK